ncbi:MAG: hypothetical protein HQK84_01530, partial [Nitrospinae bacterium]|nr:hypothetical protein [Nitrospinota bacterium]
MKNFITYLCVSFLFAATFICVPSESFAKKRLPPISANLAIENQTISVGSTVTLVFTVTSGKNISNATVSFQLPEQVTFVSGDATWNGSLQKDVTKQFSIQVKIQGEGEFSVFANVTSSDEGNSFGRTLHLNFIASQNGVEVSSDPFILMKMNKAKTGEQRNGLLRLDSVETPPDSKRGMNQSEKKLDDVIKEMVKEKKKSKIDTSLARPVTPTVSEASVSFTVSGSAYYKDSSGVSHPIRYAQVAAVDSSGNSLGSGTTNATGAYSFTVSATSGSTYTIRVYTTLLSDIANVGSSATTTYYIESSAQTASASNASIGTLTSGTVTSGSTTDSTSGRAFSVLDAMLQYAVETFMLKGSLLPDVNVLFPVTGDVSYYSAGAIYVLRTDALDWDVLGHEFGHFLSDKGASTKFDNSPGGCHGGTSTLTAYSSCAANTKSDGIRLAWSEGWATFFSVASQVYPITNTFNLTFPSIPNVGTTVYHDTEDASLSDDLETIGSGTSGDGYASENSVMSMLWDLVDSSSDTFSDSNAKDELNISH